MNHEDLEKTYESLARKVDEVGNNNSELFLAKLVLLLSHANGSVTEVQNYIDEAAESLMQQG